MVRFYNKRGLGVCDKTGLEGRDKQLWGSHWHSLDSVEPWAWPEKTFMRWGLHVE